MTGFEALVSLALAILAADDPPLIRSAGSGPWSIGSTWEGGRSPGPGDRVQIRAGDVVTFGETIDEPIRSIHVAGTLRFDPDRDTRLTVGLLKIQGGDDPNESAAIREMVHGDDHAAPAALEVGTSDRPIAADRSASIRLASIPGLDPDDFPAIVSLGGRVEIHGAPLSRSWVKLGEPARPGDRSIRLAEAVSGWKAGDRVILTSTKHQFARDAAKTPTVRQAPETEEREILEIAGDRLTIDAPIRFGHSASGPERGEVANLSRNVVVESADPVGIRGHTMFHRGTSGSISFAEFRHLGKSGKLGRYSLHFHRAGGSMRGFSVVGSSIHDSANRWITIHGTDAVVVRDSIGYRSEGHGFFLEDGTESGNFLDRNLAVQAAEARPLPGQILAFDRNEGAGFWWASGANALTRNVAAECDGYGFRYDPDPAAFASPFLRFEANEAHAQRKHGFKVGGLPDDGPPGASGAAGTDPRHPILIRDFRAWDTHWAFSPGLPSILVDGLTIRGCDFGLWRPVFGRYASRKVTIERTRWPVFAATGSAPPESAYPAPLDPVDDRAPTTIITRIEPNRAGRIVVRGVSIDDHAVRSVRVNGQPARFPDPRSPDWEIALAVGGPGPIAVTAVAEDTSGNVERTPHAIRLPGGSDRPAAVDSRPRH